MAALAILAALCTWRGVSSLDLRLPRGDQGLFAELACITTANYTVEQRRKNATQQLWSACQNYSARAHVGTYLHDACLENGALLISEADKYASAFMMEECARALRAKAETGAQAVVDVVFGEESFIGPRYGVSKYCEKLDEQFYAGPVVKAAERVEELAQRFNGMSDTKVQEFGEKYEGSAAKENVAYEWCVSATESDLQHLLRFDVIQPLLKMCGAMHIGTGNERAHTVPQREAQSRCLEAGASRIMAVIDKHWNNRTAECVWMVRKAIATSLMEVGSAIHRFKMRRDGARFDLFHTLRNATQGADDEAREAMGLKSKGNASRREEGAGKSGNRAEGADGLVSTTTGARFV